MRFNPLSGPGNMEGYNRIRREAKWLLFRLQTKNWLQDQFGDGFLFYLVTFLVVAFTVFGMIFYACRGAFV